jgi:hypothetical protein
MMTAFKHLWIACLAMLIVPALLGQTDALAATRPPNRSTTPQRAVPKKPTANAWLARYKEIVAASAEASDRMAQSGVQCEGGAPPAIFQACSGKNVGDSCTVNREEHSFTGQCEQTPMGPLACRPPSPPPPSQAAVAACNGKAAGDACQFSHEDDTISGTCKTFASGTLACVPNPPPPPPRIAACNGKSAGDSCSFTKDDDDDEDGEETVNGTCTAVPDHPDVLVCVPQQELPPAVAACDGKQATDACSFTVEDKTINGNCATLPGHTVLVCLPPPPQVLVDACTGKIAGDSCTVSLGDHMDDEDHMFTGVCTTAPDGTTLACLPPPRLPEQSPRVTVCSGKPAGTLCSVMLGHKTQSGICRPNDEGDLACLPPAPPQEAVDACTGKAAGDTCSFSWKNHNLSGACRALPDGTTLACAPLCPPHWMDSRVMGRF